jgi:hypothetical protein
MLKAFKKSRKKPIKQFFYLRAVLKLVIPLSLYKRSSFKYYRSLTFGEKKRLLQRVNYYNKLKRFLLSAETPKIKDQKFDSFTYYLDLAEYLRLFPVENRINVLFGDVTEVPERPTIVKSRPIGSDNQNSVVMKLDKLRHYNFIQDDLRFEEKKNQAVWRGTIHQQHRLEFAKKFYQNPLCDVGGFSKRDRNQPWEKGFLSIPEQLEYKYIFCIEGIDVATNLKWGMSSNSLCIMPKPKYETWFMEGTLIPGVHYVEINADYSDVDEKIHYYNERPEEALAIIENAHKYVEQFKHRYNEDIVSYLVLRKYFKNSGQSWT